MGKRNDIMKEASYGAHDKLALKQFKAIVTIKLLSVGCPQGSNSSYCSSFKLKSIDVGIFTRL